MKDKIVLASWIAGLLLLISIFWILTQGIQTRHLMRTVNNVFISKDDSRRVSAFVPQKSGKGELMGYWFKMYNSTDLLFVFSVFQDGILIPLGAIVSSNGSVKEIIPLSAHADQVFKNLPQSILEMYLRRIRTAGVI